MKADEQFINNLQHELAWADMVVIPDLEGRVMDLTATVKLLEETLLMHGIDIPCAPVQIFDDNEIPF